MLQFIMLVFCSFQSQPQSNGPDAAQLARTIQGLHAEIRDYELICEGEMRFVDNQDPKREDKIKRLNKNFQSDFAYRHDGATYMECYSRSLIPDSIPTRRVEALFRGKLSWDQRSPEQRRRNRKELVGVENGGVGSLFVEGSPERFVYINFWTQFTGDSSRWDVRFQKWDSINSHRCMLFHIDPYPTSRLPQKTLWKIWVDIERGAHVLKHESYLGDSLASRVQNIELAQFTSQDGKKVWFPIGGTYDSFLSGDKYKTEPVISEKSYLVDGTLVINQGLQDSRFVVDWTGITPKTSAFKTTREEHEKKFVAQETLTLRRDPASVQKWQEEKLKKADAQASMLETSASSRDSWTWVGAIQIIAIIASIVLVISALLLRRRS